MDLQKTVVILVAPASYALIGMLAGWRSDIMSAAFVGGVIGLGLAFGSWLVSPNTDS